MAVDETLCDHACYSISSICWNDIIKPNANSSIKSPQPCNTERAVLNVGQPFKIIWKKEILKLCLCFEALALLREPFKSPYADWLEDYIPTLLTKTNSVFLDRKTESRL